MKAARYKATRDEWTRFREEKAGPCRGCGSRSDTFHHALPRSLGGDDLADNLIPLCGDGTRGCHGAMENHTRGWETVAANIRDSFTQDELTYLVGRKSEVWLDRYYPGRGSRG